MWRGWFVRYAHTIGGTVSGLAGSGLTLFDNGGDALQVSVNGTGAFTFASPVMDGSLFNVTVGVWAGILAGEVWAARSKLAS